MADTHSSRGVTSVVGDVLLVAVVIVLALTLSVITIGFGGAVGSDVPTVAFEAEPDGDTLLVTPIAGETFDGDDLEIRGGEPVIVPDEIRAGTPIEIRPTDEEVQLVWNDGEQSAILDTVSVPSDDVLEPLSALPGEPIPLPGQSQYETLQDRELTDPFNLTIGVVDEDGEPFTGEITDDDHEFDEFLWVTDHHGEFDQSPESRYGAYVELDFDENGQATIEMGNSGSADVYYWGMNVDEVTETVEVNVGDVIEGLEVDAMSIEDLE